MFQHTKPDTLMFQQSVEGRTGMDSMVIGNGSRWVHNWGGVGVVKVLLQIPRLWFNLIVGGVGFDFCLPYVKCT